MNKWIELRSWDLNLGLLGSLTLLQAPLTSEA